MNKTIIVKEFEQDEYDKYDRKGKEALHGWLTKIGAQSKIMPETMGWDGFFKLASYWEVEVKSKWGDTNFPFRTVHIPMRKVRRLAEGDGTMVTFFVVNNLFNRAVYVLSPVVLKAPVKDQTNSKVKAGEEFADVPLKCCVEVSLA